MNIAEYSSCLTTPKKATTPEQLETVISPLKNQPYVNYTEIREQVDQTFKEIEDSNNKNNFTQALYRSNDVRQRDQKYKQRRQEFA